MLINREDLIHGVNSNISSFLQEDSYEIEYTNAKSLFSNLRIDILIKYLYAKSLLLGEDNSFIKSIYLSHIKAFNGFVEADNTNKIGSKAFDDNFKSIVENIKKNGYDNKNVIPVSKNGIPIDGAHRISVSWVLGLDVPIININNSEDRKYDFNFFKERGMKPFELDYLSIEYSKTVQNTYIVMVWPASKNHEEEIESILNADGKIIYKKNIDITYDGLVNLQRVVYKSEDWTGDYSNDFVGVHTKACQCYAKDGKLRVFLYETDNSTIETKDKIREIFKIGKHSVHINDNNKETIEIANLVFNDNAILYLNGSNRKEMKSFNNLLSCFKESLFGSNVDVNKFAIIGGVVSLFGIRDAKDLDYITIDKNQKNIHFNNKNIEEENKKIKYINISIEEIINNPQYNFIYNRVKFVSLKLIQQIKIKRNNLSDKNDLIYINNIIKKGKFTLSFKDNVKKIISLSFYKRKIKILLLEIRYYIYKIIKK